MDTLESTRNDCDDDFWYGRKTKYDCIHNNSQLAGMILSIFFGHFIRLDCYAQVEYCIQKMHMLTKITIKMNLFF